MPGTFLQVPVPALELATLGLPVYTFGADAGGRCAVIGPAEFTGEPLIEDFRGL